MFTPYQFPKSSIIGLNESLSEKADSSIIAAAFSSTASYAVDDYVIYNGVFYKCTTAHTGAWDASHFASTLVSDEFGSGSAANITVIAPEFSTSTAYAVGDYVTYEGDFYKCTTAHSAGAWNASHFTATTVNAEFMAKGRDYVTAGKKSGTTLGIEATAEGHNTTASGNYAHAEGSDTIASGNYSHAEGDTTTASKHSSHAEGYNTTASGDHSHAEGFATTASNESGHAEGRQTTASGEYSHAEGLFAVASNNCSHAEGYATKTGANYQHVSGQFNVGKATTLFEIGNGSADNARENVFEISSAGDVVAAGEVTDGSSNRLSDKFDANSFVLQKFRVTVASSAWSSTATSGYYTCNLTLTYPINTYKEFGMELTGSTDGTDPTAAESAAYSLVNYMDASDGTGVTAVTLRAKTKPTTTFYIMVHGYYMQRNAATSGVALDIETANALDIEWVGRDAKTSTWLNGGYEFDGAAVRKLYFIDYELTIAANNWTSVVDSNGYYTNTRPLPGVITSYSKPDIALTASSGNTLPTAAEAAAYNLIDYFYIPDDISAQSITVYAKTKPTSDFDIHVKGVWIRS